MKHQLYLKSLPPLATRRATRAEFGQCGAGLLTCLAILVISTVFMAVDVVFPDTTFGSVLGFQTWQMVNYVMNALFAILAILISSNILSLYTAVQRFLLRPTSRSRGQIPAVALRKPGVAAAYTLFTFRSHSSLAVVCLLAALVPVLSAVSTFLLDFKLTTHSITVCSTATNITTLLDNIDSMLAEHQMNGTAMGEWTAFSALILSTTAANVPSLGPTPYFPHDFLMSPTHPISDTGTLGAVGASMEFAGTSFHGMSTYGFSSVSRFLWELDGPFGGAVSSIEARLSAATTLQVTRLAPGQSTMFTCNALPFTNFSTPVFASLSGSASSLSEVPSMFLHSVNTDGPCFTRNSTFVMGIGDTPGSPLAQFDIQACHTDSDLQIQFVVVNLGTGDPMTNYTVEAYNCSSQIFEGPVYGAQTSYSDMTMFPSSEEEHMVTGRDLQRYATHLNIYFGLATYPISNDTVSVTASSARLQGDWTSVLRHNWIPSAHGPTYWPSHDFVKAYADALVPSLGTYLATMYSISLGAHSLWLPDYCAGFDTLAKQVLKLGAPAKAGAPLLIIILALLLAHAVLLWLYTKELPVLQTDDSMEMLLKVDMRGYGEEKVAELVPEGESESGMRRLSEVTLLSDGGEGEDAKGSASSEMGRDEVPGKWEVSPTIRSAT